MAKTSQEARDEFAARIVEMLDKGEAPPWRKRWDPKMLAVPQNAVSGRAYRGANVAFLMTAAQSLGHTDHRWITPAQLHNLAGEQLRKNGFPEAVYEKNEKSADGKNILVKGRGWVDGATNDPIGKEHLPAFKKGAAYVPVEAWNFYAKGTGKDASGNEVEGLVKRDRPFATLSYVYNLSDVENLKLERFKAKDTPAFENIERADKVMALSGAVVKHHDRDEAFYAPATDDVHLPHKHSFRDPTSYYGTAMHELGHWTAGKARLDRDLSDYSTNLEARAKEELRAELCSMFMAAETGIQPDLSQHGSYVASWSKALKDKPGELFKAISDAQKMADFLIEPVRQLERKTELAAETAARLPDLREVAAKGLDAALVGRDTKGQLLVALTGAEGPWLTPLLSKSGRVEGLAVETVEVEGRKLLAFRDIEDKGAVPALQAALANSWPKVEGLPSPQVRLSVPEVALVREVEAARKVVELAVAPRVAAPRTAALEAEIGLGR